MPDEKLNFVVFLSGTYWERRPQFSIWLDDNVIIQSELKDKTHKILFERRLDKGIHTLKIRLENKLDSDTIIENSKIIKDMLLNINDISINNVSLGSLLNSAEYILDHRSYEDQDQILDQLDNPVKLKHNGTYILRFTNPLCI